MKKNKILNYLLIAIFSLLLIYYLFNNKINIIENIENSSKCQELEKENKQYKKMIDDQKAKSFCDNIKLKFENLNKKVIAITKELENKGKNVNNSKVKVNNSKISFSS
tara:strand:- start:805 stop:1128 length:324 start_codon:yes stop_codon:yes gene_type:complete